MVAPSHQSSWQVGREGLQENNQIKLGGVVKDDGERVRFCLLASQPSHIMQDEHN